MIDYILVAANLGLIYTVIMIYTAGLTHKSSYLERLARCKATNGAALILSDLEEPHHVFLEKSGFNDSYYVIRNLMPVLLREAKVLTITSGDLPTLAFFGLFLTIYAVVWTKTQVRPNREDLRSLIGAEILLASRAG